jgi:hypothetical protein
VETSRKIILVASGSSPDRAIALERLLAAAAGRSGWAERLELRVGGIDGGAGHLSDAGLSALQGVGIDASGAQCPDLDRRRSLLEGAAFVICDRGDVADVLVDWDEAGEAEFVVVSEVNGPPASEDEDEDAPIGDDVRDFEGKIDEVLRRVVAGRLAE